MPSDDELKALVDRLSDWTGAARIGASEVIAWPAGKDRVHVAFVGDPLRMKRSLLSEPVQNGTPYRSRGGGREPRMLDAELSRVLGLETQQWFPDDPQLYAYDLLSGVALASDRFLGGDEELVWATLMPKGGQPHAGQRPARYVSSRKAKPQKAKALPIVEIEVDGSTMQIQNMIAPVGIDVCEVVDRVSRCDVGALVGVMPKRRGEVRFIVTHSFDVQQPRFEDAAERMAECGGLVMPSLAVGSVPAANFGQVALIADVGLALQALRPYKGRGKWPVVIYETDSWTATAKQVFTEGAYEMWVELTGQPTNWTYKDDFWALGAPIMDDRATLIPSTKKLRSSLERRYKVWPRELDAEQIEAIVAESVRQEDIGHRVPVARYPYLEAKVNGIVPLSCFPLAVCPQGLAKRAKAFLSSAGYTGVLAEVDFPVTPPDTHVDDEGRDLRWDWGWAVRDAVEQIAAAEGLFGEVDVR